MADFRTALEILLKAKDETKAATASAGANLGSLAAHITAVSTAFLAIRQAAQDALGIVDAVIGGAVREADAFDSLAQRIGVSASSLSELKFASDVAGVSFDTTARVLETLTRRIGDIAIKGDAEASPALERLGIRLESIIDLKADEQLQLILERLGDVANASERAAIATALFGRGGTEIVELSGRVDELRQKARDLGAAMDEEFIAKAVEARERFKEFEGAVKGIRNELADRILMEISDEELQKALDLLTKLSDLASKTITFVMDVAFADTAEAKFFRRLLFGFTPEITGAVVKAVAETKEAADEIKNFVDETTAKLAMLGQSGAGSAPFIFSMKLDDAGTIEEAEQNLADAAAAAEALAQKEQAAARAAAELNAHVQEVLASVDETAEATNRQLVAVSSVAGHWDEIQRAAALALKTQADVTAELEGMLEVGLTLDEAWAKINEQLGISDQRVLTLVGSLEQVDPAVEAIRKEFDFFAASIEEMSDRLARSLEQQSSELGATTTAMVGGTLDQLAGMWASNIVFGRKWSETLLSIVKNLVADILAELAKLAAKKFGLSLLGGVIGGLVGGPAGAAAGAGLGGALDRTQQQRGQSEIDVPVPIVEPPQITFREPEPIVFLPMQLQVPEPEVVPPEVQIFPAEPVTFPPVQVQAPAPEVVAPEVGFIPAASVVFPEIEVQVPQPEVVAPEVRIVPAAAVEFPPISVDVPAPQVIAPDVTIVPAATVEFPEIEVEAPAAIVSPPVVNIAQPEPVVFLPMEVQVPEPEIVPPEVRIFAAQPVVLPTIEAQTPAPEFVAPEVRFIPAAAVELPGIDVQVPAPEVTLPEVRVVPAAPVAFPAVSVEAPVPAITAPEVVVQREPIVLPAIDVTVPRPEFVAPEVRIDAPPAVSFPRIEVPIPRQEILPPTIRIVQPEDLIIPPVDVEVPLPEVTGPQIRFVEPEALVIPPIDVTAPAPVVVPPEVVFAEAAAVVIPPIRVEVPQPAVPVPDVSFQQATPLVQIPPLIAPPPQLLVPPAEPISTMTRNMFFNLTVNTGFSSRGVGLETARQLLPFLREVAGGGL